MSPVWVFPMSTAFYQDHGIRFEHPADWEVDESDDGIQTTISAQSPDGLTFALITVDNNRPTVAEMLNVAISAMKEEYAELAVVPVCELIDGHRAEGYDLEFVSLDLLGGCVLRCFQTARRTVLFFGQWSMDDLNDEEPEEIIHTIRRSLHETDS
jgi:hypothetical protein